MNLEEYNKNWEKELQKCKENPHYFFTTYLTINGEKAKTYMTEEEFNDIIKAHNLIDRDNNDLKQVKQEIYIHRPKTMSKLYYDDEIKYKSKDGLIYLKPGVKRRTWEGSIDPHQLESHLNHELIIYERLTKYYKEVYGIDDFDEESR